jgi:hypothetical protein
MSKNGILGSLLKVAGAGALLYGAYKFGESRANKQIEKTLNQDELSNGQSEEDKVIGFIRELKNKPNKTNADRYNLGLLEIKLNQIINKK